MERLNQHMAIELASVASVTVIGPTGCRDFLPQEIRVREVPVTPLWRFLLSVTRVAWQEAANGPDLILAGSGLTAPMAVAAARRARARSAAYLHGLDIVARHGLYRMFWRPALRRLDLALTNSANTAALALAAGAAKGNVQLVHPGTDVPDDSGDGEVFRKELGLEMRPLLLSVGRLTERKGLMPFIEKALVRIVAAHPDATMVVIGDEAPAALHRGAVHPPSRLLKRAAELGIERNVRLLGPCDEATLAAAYRAADVHVFPVIDLPGDVEGFGMVAIEAAARGLPTVAFSVGGVPDAVCEGVSGHLVTPGDYAAFATRVCDVLDRGPDSALRAAARTFAQGFRWSEFGRKLRAALLTPASTRPGRLD